MKRILVVFGLIIGMVAFYSNAWTATTVPSGNISGTWNLAGSPYYLMGDCTVQQGNVLTLEPGVQVKLPENASINVYGQIMAVGTSSQFISFDGLNDSIYWNRIFIDYGDVNSEFKYCNFNNAKTAIYLHIYASTDNSMVTNIMDCIFSNCVDQAIYGYSQGYTRCWSSGCSSQYPKLSPYISNCIFDSTNRGIKFHILGMCRSFPMSGCIWSYGSANPIITNNVFKNLSTAVEMTIGDGPGSSYPVINNNTILFCDTGIDTQNPYDTKIRNNIFFGNTTAVKRSGDLSGLVEYNSFFNNETDFVGYPPSYGSIMIQNNNGDDCDIAFNIFSDPMLVPGDHHLTQDSPCIEAGTEGGAPAFDIDGDSRPQRDYIDIGADEFFVVYLFANSGPNILICNDICNGAVLDGRKSYSLNSEIVSYDWELIHRENSSFNTTATGPTPTILGLELGVYDVTLTVTDDNGVTDTDKMELTVLSTCNGCSILKGDLDSDGDVDANDLEIFSEYFGTVPLTP